MIRQSTVVAVLCMLAAATLILLGIFIRGAGAAPASGLGYTRATLAPGEPNQAATATPSPTPLPTTTPIATWTPIAYPAPGEPNQAATATPSPTPTPSPTQEPAYPAPEAGYHLEQASAAAITATRIDGHTVIVDWQAPAYACVYLANSNAAIALIENACGTGGTITLIDQGADYNYIATPGDYVIVVGNGDTRQALASAAIPPYTSIMPIFVLP